MAKKNLELAILDVFERLGLPLGIQALIEILKYSYPEEEIRRETLRLIDKGKLRLRMDWRAELV